MNRKTIAVVGSAAGALLIFIVAYFSSVSLLGAAWIIVGSLLAASIAAVGILAGFVVVKSLFLIAAELSLLIFLAQSYCSITLRSATGDDALRSLIFLGLIYVAFAFGQALYSAIKERYAKVGNGQWNVRTIITTAVFIVFTGIFLMEIYLVIEPIIANLCVYR